MTRPVVLDVLHPVEQSRPPRVLAVRRDEVRTLAERLGRARERDARAYIIVIPRQLYRSSSEIYGVGTDVPRHRPGRRAFVHVVAPASLGGGEVRLAVRVERASLGREGRAGGTRHGIPVERARVARTAVRLAPRLETVGAHEVLPSGLELVALVERIAEECREFRSSLSVRSHVERSLRGVVEIVLGHGRAESGVVVGGGGVGGELGEYPLGQYVADVNGRYRESLPAAVEPRAGRRGDLRPRRIVTVTQSVDVARPIALLSLTRSAFDVGGTLGMVGIGEAFVAGLVTLG
mmetsp:Transcript_15611/g.37499  ORF Transcript_15611/g.37499 Transcript_15611/m.37499 type:complete len:292 (+) Transcript_15611:2257-3132(+)